MSDVEEVWVCTACGKMSHDQYGSQPISRGWDVSCMMNAQKMPRAWLVIEGDRVVRVSPTNSEAPDGEARDRG